jgi:hypothetical protein
MFLFNLSMFEFLALLSAVSGVVVALYLLSRSRRKQTVATLRFWVQARQPVPSSRRRRIQQPWSLVLQLVCLALLLLAIAQLRIGSRQSASRDHVLLLDASSWMAAQSGDKTLLDNAKAKARAFVRALPGSDRVMVVRADGLPSPVTGMETSRDTILRAIDETRPGASALNLEQAFLFASQIRRLHGSGGGEIVYAGAGRFSGSDPVSGGTDQVRFLDVESPVENCGLAKFGVRRSDANPEAWDIFIAVRNYGRAPRRVPLAIQFGGAPAGSALIDVKPGATESRTFQFRTRAAGWIEARLLMKDALAEDNRAILELPELRTLKVAVYTDDADSIRPALTAHTQIQASYHSPAQYRPDGGADVVILDRFSPQTPPASGAIWIEPPDGSPFRTRERVADSRTVNWHSDHEVCSGLRSRTMKLASAQLFAIAKEDVVFADVDGGAVGVLRPAKRMAAIGFHPGRTDVRYDLATPLLLANLLRWVEPEVFRAAEIHGGTVGAVSAPIDRNTDVSKVRVIADSVELPYTVQDGTLRFFAGAPGVVRVLAGGREQIHSLSLPEVGERVWEAPSNVKRGVPGMFAQAVSRDVWQILAMAGALGLLAEWMIFGRKRHAKAQSAPVEPAPEHTLRQAS